jgi:hypothetical protein
LLLFCASGPVAADDGALELAPAVYPELTAHAPTAEAFVPSGWRLESTRAGDLNGDTLPDAVLVLRENNPEGIVDGRPQAGPERYDTNPRMLAVLLADAHGGYDLALENHALIARTTDPSQQDPLDPDGIQSGEIAIVNGTLQTTLGYFADDMGHVTYTFRYQHERFELIGYDHINVTRSSGKIRQVSINYSTRRVERHDGMISNDVDEVTYTQLPVAPLLTMQQIGDGLEFTPAT